MLNDEDLIPTLRVRGRQAPPAVPADELIRRIEELKSGGEACFEEARLRPQDERWWSETVQGIADDLRAAVALRAESDAAIAARTPPARLKSAYRDADKAEIRAIYVAECRAAIPWIVAAGFLQRDLERLVLEAVMMDPSVLRARGQLRAFGTVIGMELGVVELVNSNGERVHDPDDE